MRSKAYITGFMDKLAEYEKSAGNAEIAKALNAQYAKEDEERGVLKRKPFKNPTTFGGELKYLGDRALTHVNSFGRGLASALGVAGLRAGHGALEMATWIPALADDIVMGKLIGVDEGRGITGRLRGKLGRNVDRAVHSVRKWSDDYDYEHNVGGGLNRFMNGALADVVGGVAGWGGLASLARKQMVNAAFGSLGGAFALLDGREKQLRKREDWIRSLKPVDRIGLDATSTATNQAEAPTRSEYYRYHMPSSGVPTSSLGYIKVPRSWRYTSWGNPVQFREFGT